MGTEMSVTEVAYAAGFSDFHMKRQQIHGFTENGLLKLLQK